MTILSFFRHSRTFFRHFLHCFIEGMLWAMDRHTFRKIVVKATAKKRRSYEEFLKKVEILSVLEEHEVTKVADAIETKEYRK